MTREILMIIMFFGHLEWSVGVPYTACCAEEVDKIMTCMSEYSGFLCAACNVCKSNNLLAWATHGGGCKHLRVFFYAFYGQRSVMAAWTNLSPWSIYISFLLLHLHFIDYNYVSNGKFVWNVFIYKSSSTVNQILQGLRVAQAAMTERWP